MKKEDKPLIVRWAEGVANLLWGYSDKSEQMAEQIQRLMQDAESFSEILDKVQVENRKLKALNEDLQSKNDYLERELSQIKKKLDDWEKQNKELSESLKQKAEELDRSRGELSTLEHKTKDIVGNLIFCLQNSEILMPPTFSKEKVMEFFNKQLEKAIGIFGVSVFEDVDGPVNSSFHRIVATTPSKDASMVGCISRSLGKGFRLGEKCIVEQQVEIYI